MLVNRLCRVKVRLRPLIGPIRFSYGDRLIGVLIPLSRSLVMCMLLAVVSSKCKLFRVNLVRLKLLKLLISIVRKLVLSMALIVSL